MKTNIFPGSYYNQYGKELIRFNNQQEKDDFDSCNEDLDVVFRSDIQKPLNTTKNNIKLKRAHLLYIEALQNQNFTKQDEIIKKINQLSK